jgi:molybdenum cofactor cytidylyltransferase
VTGRSKAALLLAGGYSSRMEEFKPLLPLGDEVILERGIRLFREAGIQDVRVVVGYRSAEVIGSLAKHKVQWVRNEDYPTGMFSSVRAGVASLGQDVDAFFLLPADVPLVRVQTIRDLLEGYRAGSCEIVFPVFGGRRGHPVLLSTSLAPRLKSWKGEGGLRSFLDACGYPSMDLEVADENVLFDVDTAADYEELLRRDQRYGIPSVRECKVLLTRKFCRDRQLLEHAKTVTRVALCLAKALNRIGHPLDLGLICAAGLLHDIAKGGPDHAVAGSRLLSQIGYAPVADVVRSHMDIDLESGKPLDARQILYLADKLVEADRIVTLEHRFRAKQDRIQGPSSASAAMAKRWANALEIQKRLERTLGAPLEALLEEYAETAHDPEEDDLLAAPWRD